MSHMIVHAEVQEASGQLYTYSLIRSLYDQGDDLIDSFWPLIVSLLPPDGTAVPLSELQASMEQKYGLAIPHYSLNTIITRAAKRKGVIKRGDRRVSLTQQGREFYYAKIEPERDAARRVNELLEDARGYVSGRPGLALTTEQIKEMIQAFVVENLEIFEQFFNPSAAPVGPRRDFSNEHERALLEYFTYVERSKPAMFRTLQDIVCGSVISAIVHTDTLLVETSKRFERTLVYLDSNYIFSLLDMRYDEDNRPAQELFRLMRAEKAFEFRVFDFTIHEITGLLRNYEKEQRLYPSHIKLKESLFGSLKAKGWTPAKVREFIANVETLLWDKLEVKITPTEVSLNTYEPADATRRRALREYKPAQGQREQSHDLAAIEHVRAIRKRREIRRIEKCAAMFLTSDVKLALYNYIGDSHKDNETVSEVIPDRLLTNILWLKNPAASSKLTLDSIIATQSRHLFVDLDVWKQFYRNVAELRSEGKLDDDQVSILLFDSHIQEVLSEYEPAEAGQLDPTLVLQNIEERRRDEQTPPLPEEVKPMGVIEQEPGGPLEIVVAPSPDVERELLLLRQKIERVEEEKNAMVLNTIERWKKLREIDAEGEARLWSHVITVATLVAVVTASYLLARPVKEYWPDIEPRAWLLVPVISLCLSLVGVRLDPLHWRSRLNVWLFNRVLRRKLKGLDRFKMNFAIDVKEDGEGEGGQP